MGMSTHIVAFKPATDPKWAKMKAVYESCIEADVQIPTKVMNYFNYQGPEDEGVRIDEAELKKIGAIKGYNDDSQTGVEVDVTKLPKDVTVIRFYNSY